jgi:hypothetical protein
MNQQFKMLKPMIDMQRASAEGMLNSLTASGHALPFPSNKLHGIPEDRHGFH